MITTKNKEAHTLENPNTGSAYLDAAIEALAQESNADPKFSFSIMDMKEGHTFVSGGGDKKDLTLAYILGMKKEPQMEDVIKKAILIKNRLTNEKKILDYFADLLELAKMWEDEQNSI